MSATASSTRPSAMASLARSHAGTVIDASSASEKLPATVLPPRQQQTPTERPAAGGGHCHLGTAPARPHDLALTRLVPQLRARLVDEPVAVQPTGGELATVRVQRDDAVTGDVLAAVDERSPLAL